MADLAPTSAITDLLWLSNRFKGILELLPKLEAVNSLEAYTAELSKANDEAKAENAALVKAKTAATADLAKTKTDAELYISKATADAAAIVAAAKAAAEDEREKGRALLAEEVSELASQKAKKVAELATLEDKLRDAQALVDTATSQYEALSNLIAEMKAKF